jgi:glycosyltransferase involved in cell wall biosynthesis
MKSAPKVSVCIPAHDAAAFLPAAIETVLAQDYDDFQLIVSDDASSDNTAEVCDRYRDPRFSVVRSDDRLGQAGNWNRCVELARGDYVILLHADDELVAGYLERAVGLLDGEGDVGLLHCAAQHIDGSGTPLSVQRLFEKDLIDRGDVVLRHLLLTGCVINPAGVLVQREAYEEAGRFTDRIVWGVDWHMWIRIALRRPVAYLADPLARYREHEHSGTSAVMTSGRNASDESWALDDLFRTIEQTRPELYGLKPAAIRGAAHRTWCFAEAMCELGDMPAARIGIRNAIRMWPAMLRQPKVWGLWIATYAGYGWFTGAHAVKESVGGRVTRKASANSITYR